MRILALFAICFSIALPGGFAQDEIAPDESTVVYPKNSPAEVSDDSSSPYADLVSEGSSPAAMFLQGFGILIVLGGMVVAVWYLFKRGVLRKPFANKEGKLKVAESRMLGNRQYIMVIEYEDKKILLGVGPGKIDYLTSLDGYRSDFPNLEPQIDKTSIDEIA